jgi:hypothetical protein
MFVYLQKYITDGRIYQNLHRYGDPVADDRDTGHVIAGAP